MDLSDFPSLGSRFRRFWRKARRSIRRRPKFLFRADRFSSPSPTGNLFMIVWDCVASMIPPIHWRTKPMPEIRWNLLTDEILTIVRAGDSAHAVSLPDVLALLSTNIPIEFAALQPHQFHAWHAFLVQLAAIALHSAGGDALLSTAADWRSWLRDIAGGDDPWCLVTDDLDRPAFMQPPVPERNLKGWSEPVSFPDELDVLVTAKNHDL